MTVWKEYKINVPTAYAELTSVLLIELGSDGAIIRDRDTYECQPTASWDEIWELHAEDFPTMGAEVLGYYDADDEHILAAIQSSLEREQIPYASIQSKEIHEEDWAYEWEKYYHAIPVGEQFLIVPIWEKQDYADSDRNILYMDPGLAFGTGNHETTQLSIEALTHFIRGGETVFDVGTGSGILSLAAASLGALEIYAYDYDEQAVRSAKHNMALNNLKANIYIEQNDLLNDVTDKADIIVANILAPLIKRLTPQASKRLNPGGIYIVSGILKTQKDEIIGQMEKEGLDVLGYDQLGDWVAIFAKIDK